MSVEFRDFEVFSEDGVKLCFSSWRQEGEARGVVCLVHGLGEHSRRYDHFARGLAESGYPVISFDLRGHGRSGGVRGHSPSVERSMSDLAVLIAEAQKAFPELPVFLYGHSLGGALVINFLLRREANVVAAVVSGPGLRPLFPIPRWKILISRALRCVVPSMAIPTGLAPDHVSRDPEVVARYKADSLVHTKVSVTMGLDILEMGEWALANAQKLRTPLLVMHGLQDRLTSPAVSKSFAERAGSGCEFKGWEALWHELHNEPEWRDVLGFVIEWLEGKRLGVRAESGGR